MQAQRRIGSDTRLRAVAAILACILGLTVATAARSVHTHKQATRAAAVLSVSVSDTFHGAARGDHHGSLAPTPAPLKTELGHVTTSDSSRSVSSRTARAPQVRGPPAQALA
jgi:hypothetical protein